MRFYTGLNLPDIKRLCDIVDSPQFESPGFSSRYLFGSCQKDNRDSFGILSLLQDTTDIKSVNFRHHDVKKDYIRHCFINSIQGILPS